MPTSSFIALGAVAAIVIWVVWTLYHGPDVEE